MAVRGFDEDVVVAAEVEGVFGDLNQFPGGMLIFNRANELAGAGRKVHGFSVSREVGGRVDVYEPRRPEADHALIGFGKERASGFVIKPVGLEGAVDSAIMNVADEVAVVHPASGADRFFAAETALEAVTKIFNTEKLDRAVVLISEQIDDPFGGDLF